MKYAEQAVRYLLRGEYKRRENGIDIQPGEFTELKHLDGDAIKLLLQIGVYAEQSEAHKEIKTAKKGDK